MPGPDGGKGGKFLILPPGHKHNKPLPVGNFIYRSGTNNVLVFLRSFYQDATNLTPVVELMQRAKIYPLGGFGFADGQGAPLCGDAFYRLNLPPHIPAANFWSVTLYDAENASGLANGQPFPSLGSRDKPLRNEDGSTDLYLGPSALEGKGANWLATVPGKGYFAILRLYGPTEAAINKNWKPGDIERIEAVGRALQ